MKRCLDLCVWLDYAVDKAPKLHELVGFVSVQGELLHVPWIPLWHEWKKVSQNWHFVQLWQLTKLAHRFGWVCEETPPTTPSGRKQRMQMQVSLRLTKLGYATKLLQNCLNLFVLTCQFNTFQKDGVRSQPVSCPKDLNQTS
jgi:hypothetical protein